MCTQIVSSLTNFEEVEEEELEEAEEGELQEAEEGGGSEENEEELGFGTVDRFGRRGTVFSKEKANNC